jgi:hypothetical protein
MQYLFCVLASIGGIFLKILDFHSTRLRRNQLQFCCDPSVIISNLRVMQCTFFSDSRFPRNGPSWKIQTWRPTYIAYMRHVVVIFQEKLRIVYFHNTVPSQLYFSYQWRDFPEIFVLDPKKIYKAESRLSWYLLMIVLMLQNLTITCLISFYFVCLKIPHTSVQ